ncbi:MAG TPA: YiiX/YebB-like N1pC/P60 family cysteine hydrolase [Chitinophagaceae bacterium]|nr:YiiX/YebB-like N1pC/P60 family cysteine hydrolase [Chitinophagaceae bacterium]
MNPFTGKRWLAGCLFLFLTSCERNTLKNPIAARTNTKLIPEYGINASQQLSAIRGSIRSGDLVTRTGNDFTSFCLRQFCQTENTYSHCGIVLIENDTIFVYHALGGEFNPNQKILREPIEIFTSSLANLGFGIFRFEMTADQQQQLQKITRQTFQKGVSFDMEFDLATDEKMYCSEFTAKMYRIAFYNDTMFQESGIGGFRFLAPDNLYLHPLSTRLYQAEY